MAVCSEVPIRSARLPRLSAEPAAASRPRAPPAAPLSPPPKDSAPLAAMSAPLAAMSAPLAAMSARRADRQARPIAPRGDGTPWSLTCDAAKSAAKMDANSARRAEGEDGGPRMGGGSAALPGRGGTTAWSGEFLHPLFWQCPNCSRSLIPATKTTQDPVLHDDHATMTRVILALHRRRKQRRRTIINLTWRNIAQTWGELKL